MITHHFPVQWRSDGYFSSNRVYLKAVQTVSLCDGVSQQCIGSLVNVIGTHLKQEPYIN